MVLQPVVHLAAGSVGLEFSSNTDMAEATSLLIAGSATP